MDELLHKIIEYDSGYEDGKKHPYQIVIVYKDGWGSPKWVDLESISPNLHTHYRRHSSVPIAELNLSNFKKTTS